MHYPVLKYLFLYTRTSFGELAYNLIFIFILSEHGKSEVSLPKYIRSHNQFPYHVNNTYSLQMMLPMYSPSRASYQEDTQQFNRGRILLCMVPGEICIFSFHLKVNYWIWSIDKHFQTVHLMIWVLNNLYYQHK